MPPDTIQRALSLAESALFITSPNPRVGCVIATPDGHVLGQGHTQAAGGPHAEVMALRDAASRGNSVAGATAWVTLEPCAHQGRTGPCCDALIAAGIGKVVASMADPNPLVAGQGFARLRAAGIEVVVGPGAAESRELNIGFFSRMVRKTPWVRMKAAASLDGVTALANGQSQWITSPEARTDGHAWRARASAVLTGIGTLLEDDPQLDVRLVPTPRQPWRVVVDSGLQMPPTARMLQSGGPVWIYSAARDADREAALADTGATVTCLPDAQGKVDLSAMLLDLGRREVNELHLEAGAKLNASFLRLGLVDELLVYLAPKLLGQGFGIAPFGPLESLADGIALDFIDTAALGPDIRLRARVSGRDVF